MSFSIGSKGETREAVLTDLTKAMDDVVKAQAIHSVDRDIALCSATSYLAALPEAGEGKGYAVSMHGSVSWVGDMAASNVSSVNVGITASIVTLGGVVSAPVADIGGDGPQGDR